MTQLLSLRTAQWGIVCILSPILLFHLLVLAGWIPSGIVWGGNTTSRSELLLMESISIAVNAAMLFFVLSYMGKTGVRIGSRAARIVFWLLFALFFLNTVGNLLAKSSLETWIFTPLTLLLSVFCFRLAAAKS